MSDIIQQNCGNIPMSCTLGLTDGEPRWWLIQNSPSDPRAAVPLNTLEQWNVFLILLASMHIISNRPVLVNAEKTSGRWYAIQCWRIEQMGATFPLSNIPANQESHQSCPARGACSLVNYTACEYSPAPRSPVMPTPVKSKPEESGRPTSSA